MRLLTRNPDVFALILITLLLGLCQGRVRFQEPTDPIVFRTLRLGDSDPSESGWRLELPRCWEWPRF